MGKTLKVGLLIETSNAYARGLLRGVAAYMREHGNWSVDLWESSRGDQALSWLRNWKGEGIIARIENKLVAKALEGLRIPVVDVSSARLMTSLPWVETNDMAIAHCAAEHLLERGFKHFAYLGESSFNWSVWREEHFTRIIREAGHPCWSFRPPSRPKSGDKARMESVGSWLVRLPKPVGVFACYDFCGRQILDACRQKSLAVPDEVAVIGVDNDDLLCELADTPLSSIIPNTHRTGYEAASLLARMMAGERLKPEGHLIEPLGVATRRSTDVLAIEDPNIVAAIRFIRDQACEGICVKDILREIPQSRRSLEHRFKKLIGRTPHEEIIRVQINRVKDLLTESNLSLEKIAARTGFSHVEYLSVAFRRETGLPPGQYRLLNQPISPFKT